MIYLLLCYSFRFVLQADDTGGGHNLYLILPVAIFYRKDPIAVLFFFCCNICADPEFCHKSGTPYHSPVCRRSFAAC